MKILIISGEYPPMRGGVGRYTQNLVKSLAEKKNIEIFVATGDNYKVSYSNENYPNDVAKNIHRQSLIDHCVEDIPHIYYGIIKKGDKNNSHRLLNLTKKLKPDIVNIQYERGLYENDTNVKSLIHRVFFGSTLNKFLGECQIPVISTLHTIMPANEYKEYVKERASRNEGRFVHLPRPIRTLIRKWALGRRYELLFEIVKLSDGIINPAQTIKDTVKEGTVIYHGAESFKSAIPSNRIEYRKELNLPINKKLLLAFGYVGSYKGFDILENIQIPYDWLLVIKQNKHERGTEKPVNIKNAIVMNLEYIDDLTLSKLFYACDAVIFPYQIVSVSGVLFDALAHGLPFVASNLEFFKEFAHLGLGITCSRNPKAFSESISMLSKDYNKYCKNVAEFKKELIWNKIADQYINFFHHHSHLNKIKSV